MNNLSIIKKYFRLVKIKKRYPFYLIATALLSDVPYMFTSLLFSYAIKFLTNHQLNQVITTLLFYFLLKIISKVARIANYHATQLYYNASYKNLQDNILDKIGELDYDYFNNEKKSRLMNTVNVDVKELSDFGAWMSQALLCFISFVISIIILWNIHWGLMLFGVIVNVIVIFILNRYNDLYENIMFQAKKQTDKEMGFFSQIMNGISEIQIFDLLTPFKKRYAKHNESFLNEHDRLIHNNIVKNIISPTITMIAEIGLMCYSVYNCLNGHFGIETVLIIQSYFGNLFSSLSELVSTLGELRLKKVSIDRYGSILAESSASSITEEWHPQSPQGNIEFKNVCFSYQQEPILTDLSLCIAPGKITGLVGKSGCGKSTLLKMILGFIRPVSGTVSIDHRNLESLGRSSISQLVTMVTQDPFLFHLSIYENLALINPDREAVEAVCKKVHLYDYVMSLPQQFETILNENATDMSGGQKQRLAIARALLKNSKIILLDEITSALDEKLSADILSILEEIKKEHTIVMITHRSREYELCDEVIHLKEHGRAATLHAHSFL